MDKNSFIMYHDQKEIFEKLNCEDAGKLIKAIFDYELTGNLPELSELLSYIIIPIKQILDRNRVKYNAIKEARQQAGSKGGKQNQANQANASFAKQNEANEAKSSVNVNVSVNDNDNDNVSDIKDTSVKSEKSKYAKSIQNVFEHWKAIMNHPNAKLDDKRKSLIRKALKAGYTETDLYVAIRGCGYTPHNMGQNDRGERFDGLHIIMRDIDRFIGNYNKPPQGNKNGTTKKTDYDELDEITERIIAEQESNTHKSCD